MGSVASKSADAINATSFDNATIDKQVTSYLRRKIKQQPAKKGDDVFNTSQRLSEKMARLEPKLSLDALPQAQRTYTQFALRLPQEMHLVRASRCERLPQWGHAVAKMIGRSYYESAVKAGTEAYLFSHIDVHADVATNQRSLRAWGKQLVRAVVPHKDFVQETVERYTEFAFLSATHTDKCKSEYGKRGKLCARDINATEFSWTARVAMESYFWEKLYPSESLAWNRQHQTVKLEHLLKAITRHRYLAVQVHRTVTQPDRLADDLARKRYIVSIDACIDALAEDALTAPPATSGRYVEVDLQRMSYSMAI